METEKINSLEEYLDKINDYGETFIYRGISNSEYKLVPSIGRIHFKAEDVYDWYEKELLRQFIRKAPSFIKSIPNNIIDWLVLAQHHGLPTRLLDWSFNPLVALFFAVENESKSDCCVYVSYNSPNSKLPIVSSFEDVFSQNNFQPIIPSYTNSRYANQDSVLTLCTNPREPYNYNIHKLINIDNQSKKNIRAKLRKCGITKTMIYPNLDSLTYDILQGLNSSIFNVIKK